MQKAMKYDELERKGITVDSYNEVAKKAKQLDKANVVLDTVWKGLRQTVDVITNPKLDERRMNDREKETVRGMLGKNPRANLRDASWLIRASKAIREISPSTESEMWKIGAEAGIDHLKGLGLDMVESAAGSVNEVVATAACLFFGFLDGATTIAESCDGGGGNNELPKKKEDEDDLSFAKRCFQTAKIMHGPGSKQRR